MITDTHITMQKVEGAHYAQVKELYRSKLSELNKYIEELQWWNKRINLVSRDVSRETLVMHVEHSLMLLLVPIVKEAQILLDVGTGGGLPGVPLGICRNNNAAQSVIMNDKVEKKIWALRQIIQKLGLEGVGALAKNVATIRLSDLADVSRETKSKTRLTICVTKHAFKIDQLLDLVSPAITNEFVFLKGRTEAVEEIKRVKSPIKAVVYILDGIDKTAFYDGKAIVHLSR